MSAKVSLHHKNHAQLHNELDHCKQLVQVGGIYTHYKYPQNTYRVLTLAFIEATDEICVVYQATYDLDLVFARPVSSWLETPIWQGKTVARFSLVSSK